MQHSTLVSLFTDIANAIRAKKNTTDLIVADTFPEEVKNITTGDMVGLISGTISEIPYKDIAGLTHIRPYAFYGCNNLTSIAIPGSVSTIGENAFANCSNLTDIYVEWYEGEVEGAPWGAENATIHYPSAGLAYTLNSDGVSYSVAKGECTDTEVTIPKYHEGLLVTCIGGQGFKEYRNLTSVTIPDSVTRINSAAFLNCSSLALIELPAGITSIDTYAFGHCESLTSITIPDGVTSIGNYAFQGCYSLTSVTIPDSVTSIGEYAFQGCNLLQSINIPDSVTSIGEYAFEYCASILSIEIPDGVTNINGSTFLNCTNLSSVTIPDSVTSIGPDAFSDCASLTTLKIPYSVTDIYDTAFANCSNLTDIYVEWYEGEVAGAPWGAKNATIHYPSDGLAYTLNLDGASYSVAKGECTDTEVRIAGRYDGRPVTAIGQTAFARYTGLMSVEIPSSVTSIGAYAFRYSRSLSTIIIPDSVTSIGAYAFDDCSSLASIEIPNSVTSIGQYAFYNCSSLTSIEIPDSVMMIDRAAFSGCFSLTSIKIPKRVRMFGGNPVPGCPNITSIDVDPRNTNYISVDGVLYNASKTVLVGYPAGREGTTYDILDGTSLIHIGAFLGCSSLTAVTIPDTVISITDRTFQGCSSLTSVNIPNSVSSIGDLAFYGCSGLTSIEIPDSVTSIGDRAFGDCTNLRRVYVDRPRDAISGAPWGGSSKYIYYQTSFDLEYTLNPDGASYSVSNGECADLNIGIFTDYNGLPVTAIADNGFKDCSHIHFVDIPEGIVTIGSRAFENTSAIRYVTIPFSVTSIGDYAFKDVSIDLEITYPGTKAQWNAINKGTNAFYWTSMIGASIEIHCSDGDVTIITGWL